MKLGEVITIDKNNTINIEDDKEYTIAGVQSYGKGILNKRTVLGKDLNMKKYQVIKPNQLMWCKVDTKNGAFGVTTAEHEGSLASSNMALANIDLKRTNPKFIEILFQNSFFIDYLNNLSTGTTNRQYIKMKDIISKVEIPALALLEQNKFVEKYNNIFVKNELLNQELEIQKQLVIKLREKILVSAIEGELSEQDENDEPASILIEEIKLKREEKKYKSGKQLMKITDEEKLFHLPKGWAWVRLGEISLILRGSSPRPKGDPKYFSEKRTAYHWITIWDITNNSKGNKLINTKEFLTELGSGKSTFVEKGEIIVAVSGSVGKNSIVDIDGYIYDGLAVIKEIFNEDLRDYLSIFLEGFKIKINDMSEGTAFPNINTEVLKNLVVPIPPLNEIREIVSNVPKFMLLLDELEQSIQQSKQEADKLMKIVLQEAFFIKEEVLN